MKKYFLSDYQPYHGGNNPAFDTSSKMLLDFKQGRAEAIEYWYPKVSRLILSITGGTPFFIATVPSSTFGKSHPGFSGLIEKLGYEFDILNAKKNLIARTESIDKLATGGDRNISVHLNTLRVITAEAEYKPVILLDDVETTGNSIDAGVSKLRDGGYTVIASIVLGKTVNSRHV
ncbi:TPA: hypothetical protein U2J78_005038 [Serratia marcescens]|nr:hypothetical protein [Serratia marcescens]